MRGLAASVLLAVAGCSPDAAPEPSDAATLDLLNPGPQTLVGEWRVAAVDNTSIDMGWAITASIDDRTIRLGSQCVTPAWTYAYEAGRLDTQSVPEPLCERARAPAEERVMATLDAGGTVYRTPENGVLISGGAYSITLFSQ